MFAAWAGAHDRAALWRRAQVLARVLAIRGAALTLPRARLVQMAAAEARWADPNRSPANSVPAPGARVRFTVGPFEGLRATVLAADAWVARVEQDMLKAPVTTPTEALAAV